MSHKGFRYAYPLESSGQASLGKEIDRVGNAYQLAGWIEVDYIPKDGIPTHIIFEWQQEGIPVYPDVSPL